MNSEFKRTVAFIFFLLAGLVLGTAISYVCKDIGFLSWLAYTVSVGIETGSPLVMNLIVFEIALGFKISVNTAQIICVIASLILYNKTCKGL